MNSNHPALISGGLFFVIGLAFGRRAFYGALAALLAQRSERLLLDD